MNFKKPHSTDAEQSVLGAIISDQAEIKCHDALEELSTDDFYHEEHQQIFQSMKEIIGGGMKIDVVVLSQSLPEYKKYLVEIVTNYPFSSNVDFFKTVVKQKSIERKTMETLLCAYNTVIEDCDHQEKFKRIEAMLKTIEQGELNATQHESMKDIIIKRVDEIQKQFNDGGKTGYETWLTELNKALGSIKDGQLVVVGARPSVGKSVFGLNLSEHFSGHYGAKGLVVTLEMTKSEYADRVICSQGRLDNSQLRDMVEIDWTKFSAGASKASGLNMDVIQMSRPNIIRLKAYVKAVHRKSGLDYLVIDHLHLMSHNKESDVTGIADITAELKGLALELDIKIILLAQLNRNSDKERVRPPRMSDLKGSGAIEQDADVILLLHRDENDQEMAGKAQVILEKNRNGEAKVVIPVAANLKYFRFDDLAFGEY